MVLGSEEDTEIQGATGLRKKAAALSALHTAATTNHGPAQSR